jgi:hypothetical protein
VPRCTSELYGVRQRHARWAQKLESTIQRKTSGGRAVENTVADKISKDSVKLFQVGIENMHSDALRRTLL